MIIQRSTPSRLTVVYCEKLFQQVVAINVRATVNVDPVSGVKPPDQVAAPHIFVKYRLRESLIPNVVDGSGGKLLRFGYRLRCYGAHDAQSNYCQHDSQ